MEADASGPASDAMSDWLNAIVVSATAEYFCCTPGTGVHVDPSEYLTLSAKLLPVLSVRPAVGTSTAKLKSRTADPVVGGTKDAAILQWIDRPARQTESVSGFRSTVLFRLPYCTLTSQHFWQPLAASCPSLQPLADPESAGSPPRAAWPPCRGPSAQSCPAHHEKPRPSRRTGTAAAGRGQPRAGPESTGRQQ